MLEQWRRAAALPLRVLPVNDVCDQRDRLPPSSLRLQLLLCNVRSLRATAHFPARYVPPVKNNPEIQTPFFCSAGAPPRPSDRYKAAVLRLSPFLTQDVPTLPTCRATNF